MASVGTTSILMICVGLAAVYCEAQLITNQITLNEPFDVYCNASRVTITDPLVTTIYALTIYRWYNNSGQIIAYAHRDDGLNLESPDGRNYNAVFDGIDDSVNNRNRLTLKLTVKKAICEDITTFGCLVMFNLPNGGSNANATEQDVTSVAGC